MARQKNLEAAALVPALYRVGRTRKETHDTWTLDMAPADGESIPPFEPGQFNMLYAFGIGEVPISISGDPFERDRIVHTIRAVGAVSRAICALDAGGVVGLRGPFGTSWPLREAEGKDVIVMAGGIGLAPLRPAVHALINDRNRYRKVSILVGARTPEDLLFANEIRSWRSRIDLDVEVTVDRATPEWRGPVGVVTGLVSKASFNPVDTVAFVCGPEVMMRFAAVELQGSGLPSASIHVSLERNMKCGVGVCGRCQFGPFFVCKDGPVFPYSRIERLLKIREV